MPKKKKPMPKTAEGAARLREIIPEEEARSMPRMTEVAPEPGGHILEPTTIQKSMALAVLAKGSPFAASVVIETMLSHPPERIIGVAVDGAEASGGYEIPPQVMLAAYRRCAEKADKRLRHALKRLKEKGLYAKTLQEMIRIAQQKDLQGVIRMIQLLYAQARLVITVGNGLDGAEFSDGIYLAAIDMAMQLFRTDAFDSDAMYAGALLDALPQIYFCAIFHHYVLTVNEAVRHQGEAMDKLAQATDAFGGLDKVLRDLYADADTLSAEHQAETKKLLDRFAAEKDAVAKKLEQARQRAEQAEAANKPLERRLHDAQERADALEQAKGDLARRLEAAEAELRKEKADAAALRDRLDAHELPVLPETGILFLGGATNFVKKLSQRHPGWTFVDDDSSDAFDIGSVDAILCYTGHLSHKRYNKASDAARRDGIPFGYVPAITNVDKLELEMRRTYAGLLAKEA